MKAIAELALAKVAYKEIKILKQKRYFANSNHHINCSINNWC